MHTHGHTRMYTCMYTHTHTHTTTCCFAKEKEIQIGSELMMISEQVLNWWISSTVDFTGVALPAHMFIHNYSALGLYRCSGPSEHSEMMAAVVFLSPQVWPNTC